MTHKKKLSRQRLWQIERSKDGKCIICGKSAINPNQKSTFCDEHHKLHKDRCAEYRKNNKEWFKAYRIKNREKMRRYQKAWYLKNKPNLKG